MLNRTPSPSFPPEAWVVSRYRRRDEASAPSSRPASAGPQLPPPLPSQQNSTPALAFKPIQHGAGWRCACAALARGTGVPEVGREGARRGVGSWSLLGGVVSAAWSLAVGREGFWAVSHALLGLAAALVGTSAPLIRGSSAAPGLWEGHPDGQATPAPRQLWRRQFPGHIPGSPRNPGPAGLPSSQLLELKGRCGIGEGTCIRDRTEQTL
nr:uncharacterized protein LOC106028586 [Cavia porcellus]